MDGLLPSEALKNIYNIYLRRKGIPGGASAPAELPKTWSPRPAVVVAVSLAGSTVSQTP